MKAGFYPKLALTGIRLNRRMYLPYILTCVGMVMMHYIISYLSNSETMASLRGARTLKMILGFGGWVIAVFALIFLFYTNSFLVRRRKKEFGLYNILGMGKRNIGHILFWEALFVSLGSLIAGIVIGIAFSKLAELILVNILAGDVTYTLSVSFESLKLTVAVFAVIFALIFTNTLLQVRLTNPIELFKSENIGERPPKANWVIAILGALLLGGAYYLAVSIKEPLEAMVWFFVAVVMVIIGSYMLFIAGSVTLCRALQKNKRYYYSPNHFVSVSSMAYRMKRNGAGLASICILATMVLVMISSTTCLYSGVEDSLRLRHPRDIGFNVYVRDEKYYNEETIGILREEIEKAVAGSGLDMSNVADCRSLGINGVLNGGRFEAVDEGSSIYAAGMNMNACSVYIVPLEDYNRTAGENVVLAPGEALVCGVRMSYTGPELTVVCGDREFSFRVSGVIDKFPADNVSANIYASLFVITPDFDELLAGVDIGDEYSSTGVISAKWYFGFDTAANDEKQLAFSDNAYDLLTGMRGKLADDLNGGEAINMSLLNECLVRERADFYETYGGLFFLGIMLSIVFISAAVLIIYYKQVSEGYEDQARFEIMKKVGMSSKDIRRSINSQLLTVFFLPLVAAGVHLGFAFPMIQKMLLVFNLENVDLLMLTTAVSFAAFVLAYVLIYRITSGAYYAIVSGAKEDAHCEG